MRVAVHSTNGLKPMPHISIATVSSLALIAGISFWPDPGKAQSLCYLVDSEGRTFNLEHMCAVSDPSPGPASQAQEQPANPTAETEPVENTAPAVRRIRIIGPVIDPDAPEETTSESADEPSIEDAEANPQDSSIDEDPSESTSVEEPSDSNVMTETDGMEDASDSDATTDSNGTDEVDSMSPESESIGADSEDEESSPR